MLWLNQVLSTPTIGIQLRHALHLSGHWLDLVGPGLEELQERFGDFQLTYKSPIKLDLITPKGYNVHLDVRDLVFSFGYHLTAEDQPGRLPTMQEHSITPYSQLLDEVRVLTLWVLERLFPSDDSGVRINRVGVVADGHLSLENSPPGVTETLDQLERIWTTPLIKVDSKCVMKLRDRPDGYDQCHHHYAFHRARSEEIAFKLDWQRLFTEPIPVTTGAIRELLDGCPKTALEYLESVGRGEHIDARDTV